MKKACLSLPGRPPALPDGPRFLWFLAAVCLTQATLGAAAPPESGASALQPRKSAPPNAYLPALGPEPLRITYPRNQPLVAQLPPLAMFDPPPPAETPPPDSTTNQVVEVTPPVPPAPPAPPTLPPDLPAYGPPPSGVTSPLVFDPTLPAPPSMPIVTPQMLVQFFKPVGSNCLGGAWSVPMFVPPDPPATKPSTATYTSQ